MIIFMQHKHQRRNKTRNYYPALYNIAQRPEKNVKFERCPYEPIKPYSDTEKYLIPKKKRN